MSQITSEIIDSIISQVIAETDIAECPTCSKSPTRPFSYDAANDLISFGATRVGVVAPSCPPKYEMARWIDHTLLKPEVTKQEVEHICAEAREHNFASAQICSLASAQICAEAKLCSLTSVCINPTWISLSHVPSKSSQSYTRDEMVLIAAARAIGDSVMESKHKTVLLWTRTLPRPA